MRIIFGWGSRPSVRTLQNDPRNEETLHVQGF